MDGDVPYYLGVPGGCITMGFGPNALELKKKGEIANE
jgi:hypothetical protein